MKGLPDVETLEARRCKVGRWLDSIPEDTPGKADLVAAIVTTNPASEHYMTLAMVDKVLGRLGLATTQWSIGHHRGGRCVCHG